MSFLSRIASKAASRMFPRIIEASLPHGQLEWLKRFGKQPDISKEALVRKYWGWTYMCAQVSAARFASTPLKVYAARGKGQSVVKNFAAHKVDKAQSAWLRKRIGKSLPQVMGAEEFEELEEHPLLDLFEKVNDQENGFEMRELTCTMLDLTGDAYWYVERDKMGVPSKLFLLRSQWVRIVPDAKKFIGEFVYGENVFDDPVRFQPSEVIHFKYPNPTDPWYGMGPVQAAAYAIEGNEMREKFMIATMANMARPDLIVKYVEGALEPKERGELEREWNAMFRGPQNAGKVKITDFRYEIDKVGWTPQELRFNEGEDWIMKKICGAFPVPIGLVDTSQISRAPRAGMEGADLFMAQFNTLPRCTRIEEKLNEQLCPMYDDRLFVAFDNPVPKDRREQLNEDATKLGVCLTTINEIRKRDGDDPVEWGDTPIMLQQMQAQQSLMPGAEGGAEETIAPLGNSQPNGEQAGADKKKNDAATGLPAPGGSSGGASISVMKGGPGSGNFGHEGRPGEVGGSSPGGGGKEERFKPIKNLAQLRADRRVVEVRDEGDDGLWVDLADGWINIDTETHSIHEDTWKEVFYQMNNSVVRENKSKAFDNSSLAGNGMVIEVDGQYVSPQLAGIPLRIRNEAGRFDKRGVGRLRASRDVIESLKSFNEDAEEKAKAGTFERGEVTDEGRWITVNGAHIFIAEGQDPEEAIRARFGNPEEHKKMEEKLTYDAKEKKWKTSTGGPLPKHLEGIPIPPAWTNVVANRDPQGELLLQGRDATGRGQYLYSQGHWNIAAAIKFTRTDELLEKWDSIRAENTKNRTKPELRETADALAVVMATGARAGGDTDTKAKVQAYGTTTLEKRHVVEEEDGLHLKFVGKMGKELDLKVDDPEALKILRTRAGRAKADDEKLFDTNDDKLLDYSHSMAGGAGFKTKDFRTGVATGLALQTMKTMSKPTTEKDFQDKVKEIAIKVSTKLGNTPAVALDSYIDPTIFSAWRQVGWKNKPEKPRKKK